MCLFSLFFLLRIVLFLRQSSYSNTAVSNIIKIIETWKFPAAAALYSRLNRFDGSSERTQAGPPAHEHTHTATGCWLFVRVNETFVSLRVFLVFFLSLLP